MTIQTETMIAKRFARLEKRLRQTDARLEAIDSTVMEIKHSVALLIDETQRKQNVRMQALDKRLSAIENRLGIQSGHDVEERAHSFSTPVKNYQ